MCFASYIQAQMLSTVLGRLSMKKTKKEDIILSKNRFEMHNDQASRSKILRLL